MSHEIALGFQAPDYGSALNAPVSPSEKEIPTKEMFPELAIINKPDLCRSLRAGQEVTAIIKARVSEVTIRDTSKNEGRFPDPYGGTRVELEVHSITFEGVKLKDGEDHDAGEAFREYLDKKNKAKEDS